MRHDGRRGTAGVGGVGVTGVADEPAFSWGRHSDRAWQCVAGVGIEFEGSECAGVQVHLGLDASGGRVHTDAGA